MAPIVWNDAYSVGIAQIDQDHKSLACLINRLAECAHLGTSNECVIDALTGMVAYAIQHFAREEAILTENDYPAIREHIALHTVFTERATFASFDAMSGDADVGKLLDYLRGWWHDHILHEDMAYREFLLARGVT